MKKIARAHTNIALIKYWGKADAKLRLPLMSSLSMTLDKFYSDTYLEKTDGPNTFILNGELPSDSTKDRVFNYLELLKNKYGIKDNLVVNSVNHVPTAAGLASSSSAFAALAAAFCNYYELDLSKKELSRLARLGSGSASRSIYGGFAVWNKGTSDESSYAYALDEHPQLDLHLIAVELNAQPKKLSSTKGMQLAQTSPFFKPWIDRNDLELKDMESAIQADDFTKLGSLAELNASEMHAINSTAVPGFTYFEPDTIKAIKLVQNLREQGIECYYTIDAGPNVKVLCQLRNIKNIVKAFETSFNNVNIVVASFGSGISYLDR